MSAGREKDFIAKTILGITWPKPDVWPSRKLAKKYFEGAPGIQHWDSRTRDLFVVRVARILPESYSKIIQEYALIPHKASIESEPFSFNGVTLACSKEHEAVRQARTLKTQCPYNLTFIGLLPFTGPQRYRLKTP